MHQQFVTLETKSWNRSVLAVDPGIQCLLAVDTVRVCISCIS